MARFVDLESQNQFKRGLDGLSGVSEGRVRLGFIRKVYGIVAAQISLTAAVACICVYAPIGERLVQFAVGNRIGWQVGMILPTFLCLMALTFYKKQHPLNMWVLGIFTLILSLDVGIVCARLASVGLGVVVVQASMITAALFLGLTIYAFTSKRDFSFLGATLFPCLFALTIYGLVSMFVPSMRTGLMGLLYSFGGALIFCGYIVFDTFRVLQVLGPDDYIEAAIQLYLDIINLFMYVLQLLLKAKRER